jgi:flavorubredoxin
VERKKYDDRQAHCIGGGIWWIGVRLPHSDNSHNPYLLIDGSEAVLINPGSRADGHFRRVKDKITSLIDPRQIQHVVLLHHHPDWCASLPLVETLVGRNVKIYAPSGVADSIGYYGCKSPIIVLDEGDSVILRSGRSIDYYETPDLHNAGLGFLYDSKTGTILSGNMFGYPDVEWNLYAPAEGWKSLVPGAIEPPWSKKAHLRALNKVERLSPERICPQCGLIIEDDINKYLDAARQMNIGQ